MTSLAAQTLARRRDMRAAPAEDRLALSRRLIASADAGLQAWCAVDDGQQVQPSAPAGKVAMPLGVKDVIDVAGLPTRAGSATREAARPNPTDAAVVSALRQRGYVPVGKTRTTEFAYLDAPATVNPFHASHTPGGSSSGSAAAVGAGVVPVALGTQTAASVCRPAAYCGAFAFKPTTGITPREGVVPLAPSFDTVGAYGLTLPWAVEAALGMLGQGLPATRRQPLRIGLLADPFYLDVAPRIQQAADAAARVLQDQGHEVVHLSIGVDFGALREHHRHILQYEAFREHGALLTTHPQRIGPKFKTLLEEGVGHDYDAYVRDTRAILAARERMLATVSMVDAVLIPPIVDTAPEGLDWTGDARLITPWTCAGTPLAVLPTGLADNGLPVAIMLAGHPGRDAAFAANALAIGRLLEQAGLNI